MTYLSADNIDTSSCVPSEVGSGSDGTRRHRWSVVISRDKDAVVREARERRLVLLARIWVQHGCVHPERTRTTGERRRRSRTNWLRVRSNGLLSLSGNASEQRGGPFVRIAVRPRSAFHERRTVVLVSLSNGPGELGVDEAATFSVRARSRNPKRLKEMPSV